MKVAFIGLGIMGSRMARHLLIDGVELTVWNRTSALCEPLVKQGARSVDTAKEAVREVDVVISMLSTPKAVKEVFLGEEGVLRQIASNSLWIDCSTVDPQTSRELASAAIDIGIRFLDAPVAGSAPQADAGELVFFVGGSSGDLDQARPILDVMSKKVMHMGNHGMGSSFKMLVNAMLGQAMAIFSETVAFGESMGMDREFLLDTLPKLVVTPPFIQYKVPALKSDNYEAQFPLEWMHKDLVLALETSQLTGKRLSIAETTEHLYREAMANGMRRQDFSAIFRHVVID